MTQFLTQFAAEASDKAAEAEGIAALGINPLSILASTITFLTLFWVVRKFALNSIVDTLEKRRKTIDDGIRLGQKMEKQNAELQDTVAAEMAKARGEADAIIAKGHEEAGVIIRDAEIAAKKRADDFAAESFAKLEAEIKQARAELSKEMRTLVADATEAIIEEKLDPAKDAKLIDKSLEAQK